MQFNTRDNHQTKNQSQKLIHFNNQQYQLKDILLPIYRLTLNGDLQNLKEYFSNLNENIFNSPIKQLMVRCSNLSILDLIKILENLPHLTFVSVNSQPMTGVKYLTHENTNTQNHFDNIDRLEINIEMPWKMVTYLLQYFPKLMNLHVYNERGIGILDTIRGSFPLNEQANVEYLRKVNLMEEERKKFYQLLSVSETASNDLCS